MLFAWIKPADKKSFGFIRAGALGSNNENYVSS
jgi:hypothetical protein